ncbi:YesL family protein [Neobacillus niacini]|uniref:YesL family protein n=1 Tax=Neobacillus niacini TaxID=86668 RepID=UPI0007ABE94E|nr:YesL family protein [Neobacillus niacini]MEC1524126.1 YesL family protein [Neobacillus niacini]
MESNEWMGRLLGICQWITRLAYINLLWLLFMVAGLFVFGAAPSTVAMFTIIRKWLKGETDLPVFSFYWQTYRKEFWKANRLGIILLGIFMVLYLDWRLISSVQDSLYPILMGCLIGVAFLFLTLMLFIFPVYAQYEYKTLQYIKTAFLLGISYPLYTMVMASAAICVFAISIFFNGVGILFFGSGLSYVLMYISNLLFGKIAKDFNVVVKKVL